MPDTVSKSERSKIMASVKSKNTSPEIRFRKLLFSKGVRYRIHYPIAGKPDVVIVKKKIAIFIDGCFWHGCSKCYRRPHSNVDYWINKVSRNKSRDIKIDEELREKGWIVLHIWEHEIKEGPEKALNRVLTKLSQD